MDSKPLTAGEIEELKRISADYDKHGVEWKEAMYGKHWKGVYIHFLPKWCWRVFWADGGLHVDRHLKRLFVLSK